MKEIYTSNQINTVNKQVYLFCQHYSDRYDYPYPAIRFHRDEGNILALREKEKGDWKKLSLEEKKAR